MHWLVDQIKRLPGGYTVLEQVLSTSTTKPAEQAQPDAAAGEYYMEGRCGSMGPLASTSPVLALPSHRPQQAQEHLQGPDRHARDGLRTRGGVPQEPLQVLLGALQAVGQGRRAGGAEEHRQVSPPPPKLTHTCMWGEGTR
jgi:hypothetical protein